MEFDVLRAARHVVFNSLIAKLRVRYTIKQFTPRSITYQIEVVDALEWLHERMDCTGPMDEPGEDLANPQDAYLAAQVLIGMRDHEDEHERKNAVLWAESVLDAFEKKGRTV